MLNKCTENVGEKYPWLNSVYSDATRNFANNPLPKKGEEVEISLRLKSNPDLKKIILRGRQCGIEQTKTMELYKTEGGLDYYKATVKIEDAVYRYQFYLILESEIFYYTQHRITDYIPDESRDFMILSNYKEASWVKGSVFYQIFPERFCNGKPEISVKSGEYVYQGHESEQVEDWNTKAKPYHEGFNMDFYGGDLYGIIDKLDYIKELGANALYLNPIFLSPSVHKYDSLDYFEIDPHFGGNEALELLTKEVHKRGMKIILDISINHTSSAAMWFNKKNEFYDSSFGAYQNENAPERDYYFFDEHNNYDTWYGVETMPKLNYANDELRNVIYRNKNSVLKKWVDAPYHIDGWRFDVADCLARNHIVDVHHEVIGEIREELKNLKSDVYLLAEDWVDCSEDLLGKHFDGTMNYFGCARPIREFVGEVDLFHDRNSQLRKVRSRLTAKQLAERLTQFYAKLPTVVQYQMMNLVDSHDVTRLHNNPIVLESEYLGAIMMLYTIPGSPNIYYGDEINIDGKIDSVESCRYPMDWNWKQKEASVERFKFYQKLSKLKTSSKVLSYGGFHIAYASDYVIALARFIENEIYFTICSTDDKERIIQIDLSTYGTGQYKISEVFEAEIDYVIKNHTLEVKVPPHTSYMLHAVIE